jgi:hypothetical protein
MSQRNRINQPDVPAHQLTECLFGFVLGKLVEQVMV